MLVNMAIGAMKSKSTLAGLFLLSTSAMAFEINLTRLFSVAQFYHFAFMIVSLALLGYGASGTFLAIFPKIKQNNESQTMGWISISQAVTTLGSYLFVNALPFDSFSIAWDAKQAVLLTFQFLALAMPFFFNGLGVGLLLATKPAIAGRTYAANLLGSAGGCILALVAPSKTGVEGIITFCSGLAALSALMCFTSYRIEATKTGTNINRKEIKQSASFMVGIIGIVLFLGFVSLDLGLRFMKQKSFSWLELRLSPYKGLSYALQVPGTEVIFHRYNAYSRVDVVRGTGIRSLPGFSYRCLGKIPQQDGLLVDGDELTSILLKPESWDSYNCLPGAVAYELRPQADTLIVEPRGGLEILTALNLGSERVTAVEGNSLIVEAASDIYSLPKVSTVIETERSYFHRSDQSFDLILFPLTATYHSVRSGAFSLMEDYRYTVESFVDALHRLKPGGLLVVTRWLQNPPSEDLKTFALAVTALEKNGGDPASQIIVFRGYNTVTILVSKQPFTSQEVKIIRSFTLERAYDLVYAQDLSEQESNIFNIMPEPIYYQVYSSLVNTKPRQNFYTAYPYEISPPTDDQPFFGHFFKWSQVKQIALELGKTMQPFGGAGYLVVVGLLGLSIVLAGVFILLPLGLKKEAGYSPHFPMIIYFGMLGLGYLLVEIPLMQRFILFLGQPAYAMTSVLFSLLFFSSIGSQLSNRTPLGIVLPMLIILLILIPIYLPFVFDEALSLPITGRLAVSILSLAPLGFLMGIPFPGGIGWLNRRGNEALIPWAWGINGATSVVAAVLAAMLAISLGFNWVFWLGATCYGIALLMVIKDLFPRSPLPHP